MENLSIIFSSISAVVVVIAILFEGKFKTKRENSSLIASITKIGWIFIFSSLIMCLVNGFTNYKSIVDNNSQYKEDTARIGSLLRISHSVNKQLRAKNISDSVRIDSLMRLTKDNGLKSDLIKSAVVDNAIKALNEQKFAVERERENVFIHLQKEIEYNLTLNLFVYEEKNIRLYEDTAMFVINRLSDVYIKKYELISTNKILIESFMMLSENIKQINFYAGELLLMKNRGLRKLGINTFLATNEELYNRLNTIYYTINKLKSYKEFESSDLSIKGHVFNKQQLKDLLELKASFLIYDKESAEKFDRLNKLKEFK